MGLWRIVVFVSLGIEAASASHRAVWFSRLPADLINIPAGTAWLWNWLPIRPDFAAGATVAFYITCTAAVIGWKSRAACLATTLLGIYVLGLPHLFDQPPGHLTRHHHHLLWFGLLLAAAPSGARYSLDKTLGRSGGPEDDARAGIAIRYGWALLGVIYFFPGLWKLLDRSVEYGSGEWIRLILLERWVEIGWTGPRLLEFFPILANWSGIGVIIFELLFPFLLLRARTRRLAAIMGLVFHACTFVFLRISFWPLVVCYVVFLGGGARPLVVSRTATIHAAGALLLAGNIWCGMLKIDSWPFSAYPLLVREYKWNLPILQIKELDENGNEAPVDLSTWKERFGKERWSRMSRRLASETDLIRREQLSRSILRAVSNEVGDSRFRRRIYLREVPVHPDHRANDSLGARSVLLADVAATEDLP